MPCERCLAAAALESLLLDKRQGLRALQRGRFEPFLTNEVKSPGCFAKSEDLPVTQEAAGSRPVAPANFSCLSSFASTITAEMLVALTYRLLVVRANKRCSAGGTRRTLVESTVQESVGSRLFRTPFLSASFRVLPLLLFRTLQGPYGS